MERRNHILVAVDFSPCSAAAFREAKRLGAWFGASVTALHVVAPIPPMVPDPFGFQGSVIQFPTDDQLVAHARRQWVQFADACDGEGGARFRIEVGNPRDRIMEAVAHEQPRMLVLGAFGTGDAHRGIGTIAAACVQRAATQVMLVRDGSGGPFRSVVACVDIELPSRQVIEEEISLSSQDGSALHILHVYQSPWRGLEPPKDIQNNLPAFDVLYRRAMERRVEEFCAPLGHELAAVKPTFHAVEASSHAAGINTFINTHRCDLAVLGTRDRFNLREYLWGSTASRVVREALCSVLAVKPPALVDGDWRERREHEIASAGSTP